MKRTMDLLASVFLLVLLSPVLIMVALLIKRWMGSPVLFRQKRPGLNTRPFTLYKFRTMAHHPSPGNQHLTDVERTTRLGRLLRKVSLDELPQLFNVIKGDMSLVGPRPLLMEYLPFYNQEQAKRHHVKPGITGWAQVNGRNALTWEEKFKLDSWYVAHHSLWLDVRILGLTMVKIIKQEGINQQSTVTMSKFNETKEGP